MKKGIIALAVMVSLVSQIKAQEPCPYPPCTPFYPGWWMVWDGTDGQIVAELRCKGDNTLADTVTTPETLPAGAVWADVTRVGMDIQPVDGSPGQIVMVPAAINWAGETFGNVTLNSSLIKADLDAWIIPMVAVPDGQVLKYFQLKPNPTQSLLNLINLKAVDGKFRLDMSKAEAVYWPELNIYDNPNGTLRLEMHPGTAYLDNFIDLEQALVMMGLWTYHDKAPFHHLLTWQNFGRKLVVPEFIWTKEKLRFSVVGVGFHTPQVYYGKAGWDKAGNSNWGWRAFYNGNPILGVDDGCGVAFQVMVKPYTGKASAHKRWVMYE